MIKLFIGGYIALWVGLAMASIGRFPTACEKPYEWTLPLTVLVLLALPTILGYAAGHEDAKS